MDQIIFDQTPGLGDVVDNIKPFCKLTERMEVPTYEYIVGDFKNPEFPGLAGRKWSKLCGFTFKSKVNTNHPIFQFVYVPKLKNNYTRNNHALHGWYCWRHVAADNKVVTSINDMMALYKFDVNAFVHSDVFNKWVNIFVKNINYALNNQVKELIDKMQEEDFPELQELKFYVSNIKESVGKMFDVQSVVWWEKKDDEDDEDDNLVRYKKHIASLDDDHPEDVKANIAYNADHTYELRNLDKKNRPHKGYRRTKPNANNK